MRVVFMGSPDFAAAILEELAHSFEVIGVYTQPDRVRSRGNKLISTPVASLARDLGIAVYTPKTLRDPEVIEELRALTPDVICVAAYGAILPKEVLEIPPYGCINVHASLLPRWRGAAPIERAILAGDEYVGVCIMRMEEGLDTGDYCIVRSIPVADLTASELTEELAHKGAAAAVSALAMLEQDKIKWISQTEDGVTYADKLAKGELDLSPAYSAEDNLRHVRASSTAHPARTTIAGKDVIITAARYAALSDEGSELSDTHGALPSCGFACGAKKKLLLGCEDGTLEILRLKPAGKKEMDAQSFLAGTPLPHEVAWGALA